MSLFVVIGIKSRCI